MTKQGILRALFGLLSLGITSAWAQDSGVIERILSPLIPNPDARQVQKYLGFIEAPCANTASEDCKKLRKALEELDQKCGKEDLPVDAECKPGTDILDVFFKSTYRHLPDFIVYLKQDRTDPNKIKFTRNRGALMWRGRNTSYVYGERDVYAIVFSETPICLNGFFTTIFKSEPNPFTAVLSVAGAKVADPAKSTESNQAMQFVWYPVDGNYASSDLWFALGRVSMDVNTSNRITVGPYDRTKTKDFSSGGTKPDAKDAKSASQDCTPPKPYVADALANNSFFSNSSESYVTVAFAVAGVTDAKGTSLSADSSFVVNAYALAKYYLVRPRLLAGENASGYRSSLGLVIGTNIAHNAFDELVTGVSYGHIVGNAGLLIAVDSIAGGKNGQSGRKNRMLIGLDYSF